MSGDPSLLATVLSGTGGVWRVRLHGDGAVVETTMRGRLKKDEDVRKRGSTHDRRVAARRQERAVRDGAEEGDATAEPVKLAVGDEVRVEQDDRGENWAIVEILPRSP